MKRPAAPCGGVVRLVILRRDFDLAAARLGPRSAASAGQAATKGKASAGRVTDALRILMVHAFPGAS